MSGHYDYLFKIHLIGDSGVGKTSLLLRFAEDMFQSPSLPTIGLDFRLRTITLDNQIVKLLIWDIPSQGRFRLIFGSYFRGTHGVIVVYDVTDRESFDHLPLWLSEINKYSNNQLQKLLVGSKCDLVGEKTVDYGTAKEYAHSLNMPFIETSAKCNINVEQAFVMMASQIKENKTELPSESSDSVYLYKKAEIKKSRCCCC